MCPSDAISYYVKLNLEQKDCISNSKPWGGLGSWYCVVHICDLNFSVKSHHDDNGYSKLVLGVFVSQSCYCIGNSSVY